MAGDAAERTEYVDVERPTGWRRWLTTVNHRDLGIMYGVFSLLSFLWAGVAILLMRTELLEPDLAFLSLQTYNALLTTHGITMLFLFGHPLVFGLAIYFVPLLIGARDMAYPRVTAVAFWLLPPGAVLVWSGFLLEPLVGAELSPARTAWTMYTPLSIEMDTLGIDLMLLGLSLTEISGTMLAINLIVTVFTERAEDVTWDGLDLFTWAMLATAGMVLFSFPVLESAIAMLLLDRNFGTTFYAVEGGGNFLWQHLFWFFGHPEVYILTLPAFGITSLVLPRFAGREIVHYHAQIYTTLAVGLLGFGIWAHHMFATGADPRIKFSFMAVTFAIALPSGVKVFNWIGTLWNGDIRLTAPMLFVLGFIANFIVGGITGVMVGSVPFDLITHDTHFVVGHFHHIFVGGLVFVFFAATYYWFPLFTGRLYNKRLAHLHFWLAMIGVQLAFFALLFLGMRGMPRRYATYLPQFTTLNRVATIGTYLIALSVLVWIVNVVYSWLNGDRVNSGDPWNFGERDQLSREWRWFRRRRGSDEEEGR